MDGFSVVFRKYVRPVNSGSGATAHQGQDQGLERQGQAKDLAFKAIKAKDLTLKAKTRTKDHNSVLADN